MSNYTQSCDELRSKFEKHTPVGPYSRKAPDVGNLAAMVERLMAQDVDTYVEVAYESEKSNNSANDNAAKRTDTEQMNDITREEFNAKLETIEAKMDARAESVSAKIDAFLAVQAERDQRFNDRLNSSITLSDEWNQKFRMLAEQSVQAATAAEGSAKEAATLKTHFWASVIAQLLAVGAIVVGAYFANQANVLSAVSTTVSVFQAGKDQAKPPPDAPTGKSE
ncbi:hypothetical protein [Pseudomonas agarici]|uniref:hypothetical protein n=1 Tax=Pseudomonas agarici TaxID=46677 RepID=UPI00210C365F|nr:hypothetical protein [Pseudomonas agarici]